MDLPRLLQLRRMSKAATLSTDVPPVKIAGVSDFFDHMRESTNGGKTIPSWRGELYFELHRGVSRSVVIPDSRRIPVRNV